jgi:hypothetical protein
MTAHRSDPGLDHLGGCMLTPCTVCGGWHSHRCDPPTDLALELASIENAMDRADLDKDELA